MKTSKFRIATIGGLATIALVAAACGSSKKAATATAAPAATKAPAAATTAAPAPKTIVDIAASDPSFSTLVTAVKAAGLAETLSGPGPFTVFAPTNDAFAKLPAGTIDTLLKPENKAKLAGILTYHVVAGTVMAKDVKAGDVKTVNGGTFTIATDGGVTITDSSGDKSKVVKTDITASNGVIHVIDTVLLPKA